MLDQIVWMGDLTELQRGGGGGGVCCDFAVRAVRLDGRCVSESAGRLNCQYRKLM